MKVAFLGLGIMGRPMAANLAKAGHEVVVWNRTPGKIVAGAGVAGTPAEAAKNAEVVWLCVADTKAVEEVLFGANGVDGVLRAGMIVVDSSTIAPSASCSFAERIAAKGAQFVDAPVTGSKAAPSRANWCSSLADPIRPSRNFSRCSRRWERRSSTSAKPAWASRPSWA